MNGLAQCSGISTVLQPCNRRSMGWQSCSNTSRNLQQCSSKRMEGGGGGERGGGVDLEAAEHGEEGLGNDSAEEQIAEGGHSQPTGARFQGLDL